jgi:hypothetical protein
VSVGSGVKDSSGGALSDGLETEVSEEIQSVLASDTPVSNINSMDPKLLHYTVNNVETAMMVDVTSVATAARQASVGKGPPPDGLGVVKEEVSQEDLEARLS